MVKRQTVLITGASGFVGRNLTENLKSIQNGHRLYPGLCIEQVIAVDSKTDPQVLADACRRADVVFHLAGVNRANNPQLFRQGNVDYTAQLLQLLRAADNRCPLIFSSSVQATRADTPYGRTKREAEKLISEYAAQTGARVHIFRLPNLFGKWCRPNYNSVVATFCHNAARGLPLAVHEPERELELLYIDDLVDWLLQLLTRADMEIAPLPRGQQITVCALARQIEQIAACMELGTVYDAPHGSFAQKLLATYISMIPDEAYSRRLYAHEGGSSCFTELLRSDTCGQISVNVLRPGVTKGRHWHNTKWEVFYILSGEGRIRQRQLGNDEVWEHFVTGERPEAVRICPGCTHEITNLSDTQDLVAVIWASECYDPENPDTHFEEI